MDKIHKIIPNRDVLQFISIKYVYWNLRTTLATFLIPLISLVINPPAFAADIADDNMIVENPEKSQVSPLHSPSNISLRQRLLAEQKKRSSTGSQPRNSNDLTIQVQPETFSNSFSEENLLRESENELETKDSHLDLQLEDKTKEQPKVIEEIDSSSPDNDTFSDSDKLRQELLIDPILTRQEQLIRQRPKAFPSSTAGTPSGYGASAGQFYIGVGLLFPLNGDSDGFLDGSYSAGFGLGDPFKSVGLEVNINFSSVGGDYLKGGEFDVGTSGYMGLKLHKYFADGTAVAVGWSNPVKWGESSDNRDTIYGVVTRAFPLQPNNPNHQLPLTLSVGVGNGGFRSLGARAVDENNVNIFGSVGLRVIPQASLVTSWTGNRLNIGSSIAPFQNIPLIINGVFTDVTRNFDTGLGFSLSAGYSFQF